jgi:hypothetical protein
MYSSTCCGRPHANHQELKNCSSSLWFYRRSVVIAVLLVVVGRTTTNSTAITNCMMMNGLAKFKFLIFVIYFLARLKAISLDDDDSLS